MTRADLIVIGGGPAGSATAIAAARRGMSVILFERSTGPVMKVCGEVLSEPGVAMAAELGCPGLHAMARFDAVRFIDSARPGEAIDLPLRPGARGVPRAWLDEGLLGAAARAGVDVRRGVRLARRVRRADDWIVTGTGAGEPIAGAPKIVVATGRTPGRGPGTWVGRRDVGHVSPAVGGARLTMELGRGDGYAGVALLADGRVTRTSLDRFIPAVGDRRDRRAESCRGSGGPGTPPFRLGIVRTPVETGIYRVGDALAAWPPLVGDGMTAAMMSGVELGAFLSGTPDRCGPRTHGNTFDGDARRWTVAWEARHGGTLRRALWLHALVTHRFSRVPLWRLAGAFAGLADLIESGVRLPPSARGATTAPYTRGG